MSATDYMVVKCPIGDAQRVVAAHIANGWQPFGVPAMSSPDTGSVFQAMTKGGDGAVTAYKVVKCPVGSNFVAQQIAAGWQPFGAPLMLGPNTGAIFQVLIQGEAAGGGGGSSDYELPEATDTDLGGVKLGSATAQTVAAAAVTATASRTYAVQLNADGQLVVNVPWTNTTYTLPAASASLGGVLQGAAVADATDEASAVTQLNALLAALRASGALAAA